MNEHRAKRTALPESARTALTDLHQLIPERALLLVEALYTSNQREKKFPDWREAQIRKFGIIVAETAMELERAYLGNV